MNDWVAFYIKPLDESNPLLQEFHGWECQGKDPEQALQNLEKNPHVPHSLFLLSIVLAEEAQAWIAEAEAEAKGLDVPFVYRFHKGAS